MEWMGQHPWAPWVVAALVFLGVEALSTVFFFLMLAGGALAGALAAAVGAPVWAQAVSAAVVGVLLLVTIRPFIQRRFAVTVDHGIGIDGYVGREVEVTDAVDERTGEVLLAGEHWGARTPAGSPPLAVGDLAVIVAIDGATAVVVGRPHPSPSTTTASPEE